ncbi:MAG: histidine phosphatase family protein [Ruminococcaceae bacterium]|nr:histidine phosphatase family protein [Oscillospiraceae bacterium]
MLLYVIRHGDPTYNEHDELTPRGTLQSAALAKRLARYGVDRIYSSPLNRAQVTAKPTCELLNKKLEILEWANEDLYWDELAYEYEPGEAEWCFRTQEGMVELRSPEVEKLGKEWYKADYFKRIGIDPLPACQRLHAASDTFFTSLGYEHDPDNGRYKILNHTHERVAVFCHHGFGLTWLGAILDIPHPIAWTSLDISHSDLTVIEFPDNHSGYSYPMLLTLSNDSHLYAEGLPTLYQNKIYL